MDTPRLPDDMIQQCMKYSWPERFKDDLGIDAQIIAEHKPDSYVWILRESGTFLITPGYFIDRKRPVTPAYVLSGIVKAFGDPHDEDHTGERLRWAHVYIRECGRLRETTFRLAQDFLEREVNRAKKEQRQAYARQVLRGDEP